MAYTVKLGTFSKLENSTAQPVTTGWAEYNVTLKGGADLFDPTLTLSEDSQNLIGKNYAVMMSRYYFITGITALRNDLCEVELKLDSLATFKTQIGAASLYILRSASAANGGIKDSFYPMSGGMDKERYTISSGTAAPFTNGVYVVNIMGKQTGTSTLYQFTPSEFTSLINKLMVITDGFDLTDVIDQIKNAVFKPMNYINSVMWFPEAFTGTSHTNSDLYIGYWLASGMTYTQITDPIKHMNAGAAYTPVVAKHPQASTRGTYLNVAPYTQYNLVFPPFGVIPIDTTQVRRSDYIALDLYVDALTGLGMLRGRSNDYPDDDTVLFEVSAQYGVQLPLLANGNSGSVSGTIATIGGLAASLVTGGASAASLIAGASAAGIGSFEDAIIGSTSTIGSNGSIVAHSLPKYLDATFYRVADADNTHNGRPLCEVRTINTLSGYIKVSEGDVALPAPLPIQQEVKAFLEGGFFYE